jgi:hypothetical protein
MADSLLIAANGCSTLSHGIGEAFNLWREGAPPPEEVAPPPSTVVIRIRPSGTKTITRTKPPPGEPTPEITTTVQIGPTGNKTVTRVKPAAGGDGAQPVPKARGGENAAAARGRQAHEEFKKKVRAKEDKGWRTNPVYEDRATGKKLIPDARTPNGNPIELKPNTPSGRAAGKRQMKKYEEAAKKKGRVIYYDP